MIHIAICDDEKFMLDQISKMVFDFFHGKNMEIVISRFSSGRELLGAEGNIDILFLDIQMAGIDGMETARKLRSRCFKGFLIFVTVLREMVFQSFEVQAYDYLVKPIEKVHFDKLMERLYISLRNAEEEVLLVQKGGECSIIPIDDIIFCEVINRKVYLHLVSSKVIDYYDRIEKLETKLGEKFFRCHRSYLIHLKYVRSYKNGMACLEGGKEIPISRLRSKEFANVMMQYMRQRGV